MPLYDLLFTQASYHKTLEEISSSISMTNETKLKAWGCGHRWKNSVLLCLNGQKILRSRWLAAWCFFLFSKAHGGQKMLNGYPKSPIISTVFLSTVVDVFINPNLKRSIKTSSKYYTYIFWFFVMRFGYVSLILYFWTWF